MKAYLIDHGGLAAAALAIPVLAVAWALMVPSTISTSAFSTTTALAIGAGAVALRTWRGGQATATIGHVINDAEAGSTPEQHRASRTKI